MYHRGTEERTDHTLKVIGICGISSTNSTQARCSVEGGCPEYLFLLLDPLIQPFESQQQIEQHGFL